MTSSVKRLLRRRHFLAGVAAAGLLATFAVATGFQLATTLGTIAFAPWVGLLAFELGIVPGIAVAAFSTGLWIAAVDANGGHQGTDELVIRACALVLLGSAGGFAGERLRAGERALRSFVSLQSALIDSTVDGICLTDADGNVLITNRPLRRMSMDLGMPATGSVPQRLLAIADNLAEPERYRKRMRELAHEPYQATLDEFELAGTGRVFRGFTAPVADPHGDFVGRIWTLREITADRELDRMRDAFVATVSHELRTPLTSISGFLEMMQDEEHALGEQGRTYLTVIRRSAERLHALVEDLLLIAQIEAHRVELELEPVDLAELAGAAVQAARPAADEKGVAISVVADHPPAVRGDRRRLTQVLDNLVSNAVKFTNDGGTVTVSVDGDDARARLVVSDTGIGVAEHEQGEVFSRFFRSRAASQLAIPGTGLGLAISRALVEQHGGEIAFASREGEGTRVTVTLPVG